MSKGRVVCSLTTLPGRYDNLRRTLASIVTQTRPVDAIYLTLPLVCARLDTPYPPLPDDIAQLCTVVEPAVDYGPICKIYGALVSEKSPDTLIITMDDDVNYPPTLIQVMLECHKQRPYAIICGTGSLIGKGLIFTSNVSNLNGSRTWNGMTGFDIPPDGRKVDLVYGVTGVLYRRDHFSMINDITGVVPPATECERLDRLTQEPLSVLFSHGLADHSLFCNDDIVLSGEAAKRGIDRYIFTQLPMVVTNGPGSDALSSNMIKTVRRMHQAIAAAEDRGLYPRYEYVTYDETILGRIIICVSLVAFLAILIIVFCRSWRRRRIGSSARLPIV